MNANDHPWKKPRSDTPYEMKIEQDFRTMWRLLNTIEAPPGHHWTTGPSNPLRWYAGSIAESTRYNASILLRREPSNDYDDRQLSIEVRLGWDGIGTIGKTPLPEKRRAILWCEMGPRIDFTATSLLDRTARFLDAADIQSLFDKVRELLEPALSTYRERLNATTKSQEENGKP